MNNIYVLFTHLYILIYTMYSYTCAGVHNVTESQRRPSPAPEDSEIVVPGVLFAAPLDAIHKCNTLHYIATRCNTLQHTAPLACCRDCGAGTHFYRASLCNLHM